MSRFPCPYLNSEVELTEERERHVAERHGPAFLARQQFPGAVRGACDGGLAAGIKRPPARIELG